MGREGVTHTGVHEQSHKHTHELSCITLHIHFTHTTYIPHTHIEVMEREPERGRAEQRSRPLAGEER